MSFGKAAALTAGFIGAFALGVWTGPHVTSSWNQADTTAVHIEEPAAAQPAAESARPSRSARSRTAAPTAPAAAPAATAAAPPAVAVSASAPDLQKRLKPLLNRGADISVASEGFSDAEQFATVVHASRNTKVPFMLLKHRVLEEGKTLTSAIRESKPEIDAAEAAAQARQEAKEDLAALD